MKKLRINGKYHKTVITVLGKINLTKRENNKLVSYTLTDSQVDKLDVIMVKGENLVYLNGSWHATAIAGSSFHQAIQALKEEAYYTSKKRLRLVRLAYNRAHTAAVMMQNGFIRVLTHIKHSFKVAFEKLCIFDVRTNSIINL